MGICVQTLELHISSQDGVQDLASLTWCEGRVRPTNVAPVLRDAVDTWIREGVTEWVGPPDELDRRTVPSTAPEFLEALKRHIDERTRLRTELVRGVRAAVG